MFSDHITSLYQTPSHLSFGPQLFEVFVCYHVIYNGNLPRCCSRHFDIFADGLFWQTVALATTANPTMGWQTADQRAVGLACLRATRASKEKQITLFVKFYSVKNGRIAPSSFLSFFHYPRRTWPQATWNPYNDTEEGIHETSTRWHFSIFCQMRFWQFCFCNFALRTKLHNGKNNFIIRHPPSAIRHPPSAIRHPLATIRSSLYRDESAFTGRCNRRYPY